MVILNSSNIMVGPVPYYPRLQETMWNSSSVPHSKKSTGSQCGIPAQRNAFLCETYSNLITLAILTYTLLSLLTSERCNSAKNCTVVLGVNTGRLVSVQTCIGLHHSSIRQKVHYVPSWCSRRANIHCLVQIQILWFYGMFNDYYALSLF